MNKHLAHSIALHIAVVILFIIDMPELWHHDMTLGQAPIIVDLSEVRIDEFTNLPAKAEFGPEDRKATVEEKPQEQYNQETPPEPEPIKEETQTQKTEPEEIPQEIQKDFLAPPEPEKKPTPEKKPEPKPTPKKPPVPSAKPKPKPQPKPEPKKPETPKKPQEQPKVQNNALKSLMREIDNNRNIDLGEKTQSAMIK